jgi:hypothetical protein
MLLVTTVIVCQESGKRLRGKAAPSQIVSYGPLSNSKLIPTMSAKSRIFRRRSSQMNSRFFFFSKMSVVFPAVGRSKRSSSAAARQALKRQCPSKTVV